MGVMDNFFPTGTYTGEGTSVSSLKHVMKRTTEKKTIDGGQKDALLRRANLKKYTSVTFNTVQW